MADLDRIRLLEEELERDIALFCGEADTISKRMTVPDTSSMDPENVFRNDIASGAEDLSEALGRVGKIRRSFSRISRGGVER